MPRVSDHAALRYCERVLGFDRTALESAMSDLIAGAAAGRFKLPGQEIVAVVKENVVVTFLPLAQPQPPPHKKKKRPKKLRVKAEVLGEP